MKIKKTTSDSLTLCQIVKIKEAIDSLKVILTSLHKFETSETQVKTHDEWKEAFYEEKSNQQRLSNL